MAANTLEGDQSSREHILSVAAQLFLERGFANVSIRDICEKSDVTPPTIYHYFGNKEKLFQAVVRRTLSLRGFREALMFAVQAQSNPEARLKTFIHQYLLSFPRDFFNPGMFLQYSTQLYGVSTERVMSEFLAIDELALNIILEGINTHVFREVNPQQAALYLMNLLMAFVLGEVHYNQHNDPDETAQYIIDLFLNGLRRQV
ncbi:MAG: TetR/AcrR family transcriptional regulator [Anaerolineales bacterium]|nr:TetR/AcrR family transcriptional regulator [Anaerolineales bacterium]